MRCRRVVVPEISTSHDRRPIRFFTVAGTHSGLWWNWRASTRFPFCIHRLRGGSRKSCAAFDDGSGRTAVRGVLISRENISLAGVWPVVFCTVVCCLKRKWAKRRCNDPVSSMESAPYCSVTWQLAWSFVAGWYGADVTAAMLLSL